MITEPKDPKALAERRRRYEEAMRVLNECDCSWPLKVYRNRHGHDSLCPLIISNERGADR